MRPVKCLMTQGEVAAIRAKLAKAIEEITHKNHSMSDSEVCAVREILDVCEHLNHLDKEYQHD
ncbi:MAG: hypothetical protein HFE63_10875 [Clostridiales bacterium]|nr:hypothetical protein [Clostridiales bacterium]